MGIVQHVSILTLRHVLRTASMPAGVAGLAEGADALVGFLINRLADPGGRLTAALATANARAWKTLEISLAGESLLSWLDRSEDRAFRQQVRAFLEATPLQELPSHGPEFRQQCLRELRAARKARRLTEGLDPRELGQQAGAFVRFTEPHRILEAEWQAVDRLAEDLRRSDYPTLADLVALRPAQGSSLLVVTVRYFFQKQIEADPQLFHGLAWTKLEDLEATQEKAFAALTEAFERHGQLLDQMLDEVLAVVVQTRDAVLDLKSELHGQREQIQELGQSVLRLLDEHKLQRRELRPSDSLSIRGDTERDLVKGLVARYRALPEEQRRQLPALLNELGKLQVVAGEFEAAQRDFREVAALTATPAAQAEAHYNAYRTALERRDWPGALQELLHAVQLEPRRFAPFPIDKYEPQRILGAGGFGVAFLCRHRNSGVPLVVKALAADDLDRDISQVFAEARILEELDHPAIIRLRDCDYVDPALKSRPYLVMDYFEGMTLEEHVQKHGPLAADDWPVLAHLVADGLQAAHVKGILHRDVKPANLLVRRESAGWRVKLIDFGLAMRRQALQGTVGSGRTLAGSSIAGTLDYAAPEQMGRLPGVSVGAQADVYSFGKTCCYALFRTTQPSWQHWRKLTEPMAELLGTCLAEAPAERPKSFADVIEALDRQTPSHETAQLTTPEPSAWSPGLLRTIVWAVFRILLAGGLGAGAGAALGHFAAKADYVLNHSDETVEDYNSFSYRYQQILTRINSEDWVAVALLWPILGAFAGVVLWGRGRRWESLAVTTRIVQLITAFWGGTFVMGVAVLLGIPLGLDNKILPSTAVLTGSVGLVFGWALTESWKKTLIAGLLAVILGVVVGEAAVLLGRSPDFVVATLVPAALGGSIGVLAWAKKIEWDNQPVSVQTGKRG
jgi:tetratricopeptide (TPR) repeat protein